MNLVQALRDKTEFYVQNFESNTNYAIVKKNGFKKSEVDFQITFLCGNICSQLILWNVTLRLFGISLQVWIEVHESLKDSQRKKKAKIKSEGISLNRGQLCDAS